TRSRFVEGDRAATLAGAARHAGPRATDPRRYPGRDCGSLGLRWSVSQRQPVNGADFVPTLRARAVAFGMKIAPEQAREFEKFYGLLAKWNRRINLTALELGLTPPTETLDRLFIEPIVASELISDGRVEVIDLGSGAGSPALPIKILRPGVRLTMVETKGRKA